MGPIGHWPPHGPSPRAPVNATGRDISWCELRMLIHHQLLAEETDSLPQAHDGPHWHGQPYSPSRTTWECSGWGAEAPADQPSRKIFSWLSSWRSDRHARGVTSQVSLGRLQRKSPSSSERRVSNVQHTGWAGAGGVSKPNRTCERDATSWGQGSLSGQQTIEMMMEARACAVSCLCTTAQWQICGLVQPGGGS